MFARRLMLAALTTVSLTGCGTSAAPMAAQAPVSSALSALAETKAGVTPAMAASLVKLLDANGDGQITKNEGFVEMKGPQEKDAPLISNYYDEKWKNGAHVKPMPAKTVIDNLAKGYTLTIRAIKGDKEENGYNYIPMSPTEIDRLTGGVTDILKTSPLFKSALLGGGVPVNYVVIPHFLFRKPKNVVEFWSGRKVESTIRKHFADKTQSITINPQGKHAQGAFVLLIQEHPAVD